jgi:FlaA1/EpsC-like NDP-sugar epimerase/very-short-patch-repair endonuclease
MNRLQKLTNWYFKRDALPYWCVFIFDCAATFLAGLIVFWAYHKTLYNIAHFWGIVHTIFIYVFIAMIGFRTFRTYSGVLRYSSFVDLQHIAYANILSLMVAILAHYPLYQLPDPFFEPFRIRHLIVMYAVSTTLMWAGRVLIKELYDISSTSKGITNALVYGIKEGGVGLAKFIRNETPSKYNLRGFISPNGDLCGHLLMGVGVYQVEDLPDVLDRFRIRSVLVSPLRNNEFRNDQQLQSMLTDAGVKIYMTEGFSDDNSKRLHLKEVSIDDLLPRDEIKVDMESVSRMLTGQRILITGSAGSIGSEMVRQIAKFAPAEMMLIDQAETPQHDIRLMMRKQWPDIKVHTVVTSICKEQRMEKIFSEFRPDYVFHAAAYKHVPMMEDNPSESVQNNVLGTKILADLSVKYGVKKFVMISTDKAVNPTNVMGCSKRICEIYVQALDAALKSPTPALPRREGASPTPNPSPVGRGVSPTPAPSPVGRGTCQESPYMTADPALYEILKEYSREMRKNPTDAERAAWTVLSDENLGYKFRRQHIIGDYIVDFVCLEKQLVIEIDGEYHNEWEQQINDEERTEWLHKRGFNVIRFTNAEVIAEPTLFAQKVKSALNSPLPTGEGSGVGLSSLPTGEGSGVGLSPLPTGEGQGGASCQFVTTRFGNVLGSNGSVIPLFERQIKEGGPVTVTDPNIIRYFMLIPEACKLVLEAGTMGNGGEIFVFDMGKPVKIADLAKRMILLSGAKDIEIKYTGLRPGEKLYEEMLSTEENTKPSFHEKIRIATVREYDFEKVSRDIDELIAISRQYDDMATVRKMKEIVPEFISNNSVYSALDK